MGEIVLVLTIYYVFLLLAIALVKFSQKVTKQNLSESGEINEQSKGAILKQKSPKIFSRAVVCKVLFSNEKTSTMYQKLLGKSFFVGVTNEITTKLNMAKGAGINPFLPFYKHEEYREKINYFDLYFFLKRFKNLEKFKVKCNLFLFVKNIKLEDEVKIKRLVKYFDFRSVSVRVCDASSMSARLIFLINLLNTNVVVNHNFVFKKNPLVADSRETFEGRKYSDLFCKLNVNKGKILLVGEGEYSFDYFKHFRVDSNINCVVKNLETGEVLKTIDVRYFEFKTRRVYNDKYGVQCTLESTFDFKSGYVLCRVNLLNNLNKKTKIVLLFGNKFSNNTGKNVFYSTMQKGSKNFKNFTFMTEKSAGNVSLYGVEFGLVLSPNYWAFSKKVTLKANANKSFFFAFKVKNSNTKTISFANLELAKGRLLNACNEDVCDKDSDAFFCCVDEQNKLRSADKNFEDLNPKIERSIRRVASDYRDFPRLKIFSDNRTLNLLVNDFLPAKILENKICNYYDVEATSDFLKFLNKTFDTRLLYEEIAKKTGSVREDFQAKNFKNYFLQKGNFFKSYFNLVFCYLGVWQEGEGIYLNPDKSGLVKTALVATINRHVFLKITGDDNMNHNKKTTCEGLESQVKVNDVAFSNLRFFKIGNFLDEKKTKSLSLNVGDKKGVEEETFDTKFDASLDKANVQETGIINLQF